MIRTVLEDMGLQAPLQAKKKWDNLKKRYKVCEFYKLIDTFADICLSAGVFFCTAMIANIQGQERESVGNPLQLGHGLSKWMRY